MKLERISVSGQDGLKGWKGEQPLAATGVDVFAGPNGAGKSTRLLTVLAGLRGLASSPQDAVREYLGPDLPAAHVDLTFDGARISRNLSAGTRTADAKRADAIADQLVGSHVVRWDLADFAAGTTANRQALLDRVCDLGAAGWTVDALVDELTPSKAVDDLVAAMAADLAPDVWLAAAIDWAKKEYTTANREQKRLKASAERAVEKASEFDGPTVPEIDARLKAAREMVEKLAGRVAAQEDARRRAEAQRQRREELARVRAQLEELPEFDGCKEAVEVSVSEARARVDALEEEANNARRSGSRAERTVAQLESAVKARREAVTGPCVHCGHADPLGGSTALEEAEAQLEDAREILEEAELELAAVQGELAQAKAALKEDETLRARWREQAQLTTRIRDLESGLEDVEDADADAGLQEELAKARAEVRDLEQSRTRAVRAAEAERQAQLEAADRDEAVQRLEDVKALGKQLKEMQRRLIESAFGPIEREASALVQPVLAAPVRFESADRFGILRDGALVPWWALSDGERAVVGAGISYAFARLGGSGWRAVILDGAEAVDEDRIELLVAALNDRIKVGDLDNALLALRAKTPPEIPGATVHFLTQEQTPC